MKKNYLFLIIALWIAGFYSCSDDKEPIRDLVIEGESFTTMLERSVVVNILSGNKNYEVTSADENVITIANIFPDGLSEYDYCGYFTIKPEGKGTTVVTVRDNVTGQTKTLTVTVTDTYYSLQTIAIGAVVEIASESDKTKIKNDILANAPFNNSYIFTMKKDEACTLYIFASEDDLLKGKVLYRGTYAFTSDGDDMIHLSFTYRDAEADKTYTYEAEGAISLIRNYFRDKLSDTKVYMPAPTYIYLVEDLTDRYKAEYPELQSARIAIVTVFNNYFFPDPL